MTTQLSVFPLPKYLQYLDEEGVCTAWVNGIRSCQCRSCRSWSWGALVGGLNLTQNILPFSGEGGDAQGR